tara:strand:- start:385 stop:546 length:162 start_codon:yes stop_codon:yes gene_type:complete
MFADYEYECQLYKETLQEIQYALKLWRIEGNDADHFDFLYTIETIIDQVGVDE